MNLTKKNGEPLNERELENITGGLYSLSPYTQPFEEHTGQHNDEVKDNIKKIIFAHVRGTLYTGALLFGATAAGWWARKKYEERQKLKKQKNK